MSFIDWLFPKRCVACKKIGDYFCADCFSRMSFSVKLLCIECNRNVIDGLTHTSCKKNDSIDGVFAAVVYSSVMKKALYTFKYPPYVSDLKNSLGELFYEGIIQHEAFIHSLTENSVFMPIPLHPQKFKKRGYNHAALLAKDLSKRLAISYSDILIRKKMTMPQFGLSKHQRGENMRDAFSLKVPISAQTVFLIDDILTSGSTMKEAAKVLKESGVTYVWGLVLARDQRV